MLEFKVNDYITLKLENDKTNIYINGEKFIQCKYLLIQFTHDYDNAIDDIYEAAELPDYSLEDSNNNLIEPNDEFWGHCSNLQAWFENNYDTRLNF